MAPGSVYVAAHVDSTQSTQTTILISWPHQYTCTLITCVIYHGSIRMWQLSPDYNSFSMFALCRRTKCFCTGCPVLTHVIPTGCPVGTHVIPTGCRVGTHVSRMGCPVGTHVIYSGCPVRTHVTRSGVYSWDLCDPYGISSWDPRDPVSSSLSSKIIALPHMQKAISLTAPVFPLVFSIQVVQVACPVSSVVGGGLLKALNR